MPFNLPLFYPDAHGVIKWWNHPKVLPTGAAVVVAFDNNDRVWGWVLEKGTYGNIRITTDEDRARGFLVNNLPLASVQAQYNVGWWQYEVLPKFMWLPTRPRSSRVLAQVAARSENE